MTNFDFLPQYMYQIIHISGKIISKKILMIGPYPTVHWDLAVCHRHYKWACAYSAPTVQSSCAELDCEAGVRALVACAAGCL